MIEPKKKICKGSSKDTRGHGCETEQYMFKFGLCKKCFIKWLKTEQGNVLYQKTLERSKKVVMQSLKRQAADKRNESKKKTPKINLYSSTAWRYCSRYILLYYSDKFGVVKCSTSGREYKLPTKNIQAGHYYKATEHASLAFEFKNLAPQSLSDNVYHSGKPEIMKEWIINQHGAGVIDELIQIKNQSVKLDKYTLDEYRIKYRQLFNDLVKEKGLNPWK